MREPDAPSPVDAARLLALDTGSPRVSVAVALAGTVVAERSLEQARSSAELLRQIDDCLRAAQLRAADLTAIAVLRGPGSFTGLRIGLATVHGLRAALGTAVAVLPSLRVLAEHARERRNASQSLGALAESRAPRAWIGAVDALRGEWYMQSFSGVALTPEGEAAIVSAAALAARAPATVCGFGVAALAAREGWPADCEALEADSVAATAARLAPNLPELWDAQLLTAPLYLREPAVTLPAR